MQQARRAASPNAIRSEEICETRRLDVTPHTMYSFREIDEMLKANSERGENKGNSKCQEKLKLCNKHVQLYCRGELGSYNV